MRKLLITALSTILLLSLTSNAQAQGSYFNFSNNTLTVTTSIQEIRLEAGAIVYVQDLVSGEVLANTSAFTNRPSVTHGFIGFTSRDTYGNYYVRWPTAASNVDYTELSATSVKLTYSPLYFHSYVANGTSLTFIITVEPSNGEIIISATGQDTEGYAPFSIDIPVMNTTTKSVILSSGAQYLRSDPDKISDHTSFKELSLHSPDMAVIEGNNSVFAFWTETADSTQQNIELRHSTAYDTTVMKSGYDPKNADATTISSATWRLITASSWVDAAKAWRTHFEARTGAKPLWENKTPWVRNIHAAYNAISQNHGSHAQAYAQIADVCTPQKTLYFMWQGSRIILFGDHSLVTSPRPNPDELYYIKDVYRFPLILYHPVNLIFSESGVTQRYSLLTALNWLPPGYVFNPDYVNPHPSTPGDPQKSWQDYWTPYKFNYVEAKTYQIHPATAAFKNYIVRNFANYCKTHRCDGAYMDTLGFDPTFTHIPADKRIMEGKDYASGMADSLSAINTALPNLGIMSEVNALWAVPYTFYSWEGSSRTIVQNQYANTKINHPLRAALLGSYVWGREANDDREVTDDVSAYMSTLPQISLVGDYGITDERALWSQERAKLFCDMELFNDLPDNWDPDALAYYRSRIGHWFKYKKIGDSYAYVEEIPGGGEIIWLTQGGTYNPPYPTSAISPSPNP